MDRKMDNRNITDVRGIRARGAHIGIKSKRRDLALIVSDVPGSAAGLYTRNKIVAYPVKLTEKNLKDGKAQAIVVTSGNANACNGPQGKKASTTVIKTLAEELGIDRKDVIFGTTGVIGEPYPTDKVVDGIKKNVKYLDNKRMSGIMVANAIMTTDTFQKEGFFDFKIGGKTVNMAGIAKGAGMIHPDMATMLAFIVSDADIDPGLLDEALMYSVERTFNMITVDGDTSTNDMVVVLSNGLAGNPRITEKGHDYHEFRKNLTYLCEHLAKAIVSDGEGATKFIEYRVMNARNESDAKKVVRTVSDSNLVKTAIFGRDPNWGRIIAAVGRSKAEIDPEKIDIFIGSKKFIQVAKKGSYHEFDKTKLKKMLRSSRIKIFIDLHQGGAEAVGWGTDFSYEYVRINAEYTS
ncbi:MAG: bifunctional glutamate N-acetyltransferase/amino-acid acetyltransferase ArgJ [Thermoplasmatota archaeon]